VIIVTGADAQFFRSAQQLLLSLERRGYRRCLFYDLGLTRQQQEGLSRRFAWVEQRSLPTGPPHLSDLGNYGWKPTVIAEVLEQGQRLLWLDSACVVTGDLGPVQRHLDRAGLWVPLAGCGPLKEMTHAEVIRVLGLEEGIQSGRFRAGGVCAFDPFFRQGAILELVQEWRRLAWDPALLAPPGSHRGNHRFDQTLLTALIARSGWDASQDEIDISSSRPVPFLRTRNKVSSRLPLALDPLVRVYFWLRRFLDVTHWKWKTQRGSNAARHSSMVA